MTLPRDLVGRVLIADRDPGTRASIRKSLEHTFGTEAITIDEANDSGAFEEMYTRSLPYHLTIVDPRVVVGVGSAENYSVRAQKLFTSSERPVFIMRQHGANVSLRSVPQGVIIDDHVKPRDTADTEQRFFKRMDYQLFALLANREIFRQSVGIIGTGRLGMGLAERLISEPSRFKHILLYNGKDSEKAEDVRKVLESAIHQQGKSGVMTISIADHEAMNALCGTVVMTACKVGKSVVNTREFLPHNFELVAEAATHYRGNTRTNVVMATNGVDPMMYIFLANSAAWDKGDQAFVNIEGLFMTDTERVLASLRERAMRAGLFDPETERSPNVAVALVGPHHKATILDARIRGFSLETVAREYGISISYSELTKEITKYLAEAYRRTDGEITGVNAVELLARQVRAIGGDYKERIPATVRLTADQITRVLGYSMVRDLDATSLEKRVAKKSSTILRTEFPYGLLTGWLVTHDMFGHPIPVERLSINGPKEVTKSAKDEVFGNLRADRTMLITYAKRMLRKSPEHPEYYESVLRFMGTSV